MFWFWIKIIKFLLSNGKVLTTAEAVMEYFLLTYKKVSVILKIRKFFNSENVFQIVLKHP